MSSCGFDGELDGIQIFAKALSGEDEIGVVVRAHVLIEFEIEQYFCRLLPRPDVLKKLLYKAKLRVALACGLRANLESPLSFIADLRNDFAHQINRNITRDDIEKLRKKLAKEERDAFDHATQHAVLHHNLDLGSFLPKDDLQLYLSVLRSAVVHERLRIAAHGSP